MNTLNLNLLENSWTATFRLNNGEVIDIWHTAWAMTKRIVSEVLSVSSDYPRFKKSNPESIILYYPLRNQPA